MNIFLTVLCSFVVASPVLLWRWRGYRRATVRAPWAQTACIGALVLGGCGGGGGGGDTMPTPLVVQGTAAVGKPVVNGSLTLRCVSGDTTGSTGTDGRFKIDAAKITFPCLMIVSGGTVDGAASSWTLVSAVTKVGVTNVTPLTHMVLARLLGGDPNSASGNLSAADLQANLTAGTLAAAKDLVRTELARLLGAAPSVDLDPLATAFAATSGDGMDALITQVMNGLRWTAKTLTQASLEIAAGKLQVKEVPGNCRPAVLTGFAGKFDDVAVQVPYDPNAVPGDGGTGGGDSGGAGGGDGAGTGGSLGQFLNALVRVERNDGSLLGQAVTDVDKGLVTIVPCRYQGALHISVKAQADGSTQYYDESSRQYAAFPAGAEMNVVVSNLDKNVGITILTEAAWNYLGAKYGTDGWKSAVHINEANSAVSKEFNRFLPAALQVSDITRLPVLLNSATATGSVGASENGKYGIVNSGLARAAGLLRTGDVAAALKMAQQMGQDLCDGVLDGQCCKGSGSDQVCKSVAGDSKDLTYLVPQLGEFLNAGIGDIATNCGDPSIQASSLRIVQIKVHTANPTMDGLNGGLPFYQDRTPIFLMRSDGKVFFWSTRTSVPQPYAPDLTFRQLFPQGTFLGATLDGRAYRAPLQIADSTLPRARQTTAALAPVEEPAYRGMTSVAATDPSFDSGYNQTSRFSDGHAWVAGGYGFDGSAAAPSDSGLGSVVRTGVSRGGGGAPGYFAVTLDGALFAWGDNGGGELGLGLDRQQLEKQLSPALVRFPPNTPIVSVTGREIGAIAIDRSGSVWEWGVHVPQSVAPGSSVSPRFVTDFEAFKPIRQIECATYYQCAALTNGGDLLVWGLFFDTPFSPLGTVLVGKTYGVTKVPLLGGHKATFIGAAGFLVYAVLDDGSVVLFPTKPSTPLILPPDFLPASTAANCTGPR